MKEIVISVSPLPPFVSFQFKFPIEKMSHSILFKDLDPVLGGEFIIWCIEKILKDQFIEDDANGAWGKCYPAYMSSLYGAANSPDYKSYKESITCSAIITQALCSFCKNVPSLALKHGLLPRLQRLFSYLKNHQDSVTGGFGLARLKYRGPAGIAPDLRHTIWAVLCLWDLQEIDLNSRDEIVKSIPYIYNAIFSLEAEHDIALTYAATQRLLAMPRGNEIMQLSSNKYRLLQKKIESSICAKYNKYQGSWDMETDPENASIDNVMDILSMVMVHDQLEPDLALVMGKAARYIYDNHAIALTNEKIAIPFMPQGGPDLANTIQFLHILVSDSKLYDFSRDEIQKLINFVTDSKAKEPRYNSNCCSWKLAAALHLAACT